METFTVPQSDFLTSYLMFWNWVKDGEWERIAIHLYAYGVCFVYIVIIKIDMLLNTLFASALSVLKVHSMMYFVLLCKLLFGWSTLQTDQFSCYCSKQKLEMSEVSVTAPALLYHIRCSTSADKFRHKQVHSLLGGDYLYWFDFKLIYHSIFGRLWEKLCFVTGRICSRGYSWGFYCLPISKLMFSCLSSAKL